MIRLQASNVNKSNWAALDVSNYYEAALYIVLIIFDIFFFQFACKNVKRINLWAEREKVNKNKLICMNANLIFLISVKICLEISGLAYFFRNLHLFNSEDSSDVNLPVAGVGPFLIFQSIYPFLLMLIYSISCKNWIRIIYFIKSPKRKDPKVMLFATSFINFLIISAMLTSLIIQCTNLDFNSKLDNYQTTVAIVIGTTAGTGLYFFIVTFYMLFNVSIMYDTNPEFHRFAKYLGYAVLVSVIARVGTDILNVSWEGYGDFRSANFGINCEHWGWALFLLFYFTLTNNLPIIAFLLLYSVHAAEKSTSSKSLLSGKESSLLDPILND